MFKPEPFISSTTTFWYQKTQFSFEGREGPGHWPQGSVHTDYSHPECCLQCWGPNPGHHVCQTGALRLSRTLSSATLSSHPEHPRSNEMSSCGACSVLRSAPSSPSHRLCSLQAGAPSGLLLCPCQSTTSTPMGTALSGLIAPLPSAAIVRGF